MCATRACDGGAASYQAACSARSHPDPGAPRRAVFTYGGQVNWMRYILSMRTPSKFPLAVTAVSGIMTAAYVGIGAVGCGAAAARK